MPVYELRPSPDAPATYIKAKSREEALKLAPAGYFITREFTEEEFRRLLRE
jgi:hypothetical protein